MSLKDISKSTLITFHKGATSGLSKALVAREFDPASRKAVILVEETPFHPLNHRWPDQPSDFGTLEINGVALPVIDALMGAVDPVSSHFYLGEEIPPKGGEVNLLSVVAHIVSFPENFPITKIEGKMAKLDVDSDRRKNLSAAHSACHLMSLALNKSAKEFWKKEVQKDSLGNPDLDRQSIQSSSLTEKGSVDHYRFGKSLRKAGFESSVLFERIKDFESSVNKQLKDWLAAASGIVVEATGLATIDSQRTWRCRLPDGNAVIPCGGTHLNSLGELKALNVSFELIPDCPEMKAHTTFTAAGS